MNSPPSPYASSIQPRAFHTYRYEYSKPDGDERDEAVEHVEARRLVVLHATRASRRASTWSIIIASATIVGDPQPAGRAAAATATRRACTRPRATFATIAT